MTARINPRMRDYSRHEASPRRKAGAIVQQWESEPAND